MNLVRFDAAISQGVIAYVTQNATTTVTGPRSGRLQFIVRCPPLADRNQETYFGYAGMKNIATMLFRYFWSTMLVD